MFNLDVVFYLLQIIEKVISVKEKFLGQPKNMPLDSYVVELLLLVFPEPNNRYSDLLYPRLKLVQYLLLVLLFPYANVICL